MRKERKIEEAKYFLQKMKETENNYKEFEFNLSAFVNAARSAIQYAYEEVRELPAHKKWFEEKVRSNKILKFFKDKRDVNNHTKPVGVDSRSVTVYPESISLRLSVGGELLQSHNEPWIPPKIETVNKFTNWDGAEEDVFSASEKYLREVESFINEGRKEGYLG